MKKKLKKYLEMREQEMRMKMQDLERQVVELGRRVNELDNSMTSLRERVSEISKKQFVRETFFQSPEETAKIEQLTRTAFPKNNIKYGVRTLDIDNILSDTKK